MSMFGALEVYYDDIPREGPMNMAVDEALLAAATLPILRFYRWQSPAVSFGYFGSYAEVAAQNSGREVVRRWTGGGIVPHGADLTYSVIIPANDPLFVRSSLEIYFILHEAIRKALNENGIAATLAPSPSPKLSEECFANAVKADVMSAGRKIAGAAHRRSRSGLLHQGSIQEGKLPERFGHDLAQAICDRFERQTLTPQLVDRARAIAQAKYGTTEWLMRR